MVGRALVPLLTTAGIWRGPQDGCAAQLGILPVAAINLAVAPSRSCKFALLVTEGALSSLPAEELQAALAHELGHVELGHFAARSDRRADERETQRTIDERASTGTGIATAIPGIGPLIALGIAGGHAAAQAAAEGTYRKYDQAEESAADRYAVDLLNRLPGSPPSRCRHLAALLARLDRERAAPLWSGWLSTHPSPATRLEAVKEKCA